MKTKKTERHGNKKAEKPIKKEEIEEKIDRIEVAVFRLAGRYYGLECIYIREVSPLKQLTYIPGTPDFISGIISIRGEIISVVSLVKFLELPQKGLTEPIRVIILRHHDMEFGILAEEVVGTVSIPIQEIRLPLRTRDGPPSKYLKGVTKNRLIVLDALTLLSEKKMIVFQEV